MTEKLSELLAKATEIRMSPGEIAALHRSQVIAAMAGGSDADEAEFAPAHAAGNIVRCMELIRTQHERGRKSAEIYDRTIGR